MTEIFVNYRTSDTKTIARLVEQQLSREFGESEVFFASRRIRVGTPFAAELEAALESCRVLLAVIGREWLTAQRDGRRRLDDPTDWVRREIARALARGIHVVPVLVDGVSMPDPADLPAELRGLTERQKFVLGGNHGEPDVDALIRRLREALPELPRPAPTQPPTPPEPGLRTFGGSPAPSSLFQRLGPGGWMLATYAVAATVVLLRLLAARPADRGDSFSRRLSSAGFWESAYGRQTVFLALLPAIVCALALMLPRLWPPGDRSLARAARRVASEGGRLAAEQQARLLGESGHVDPAQVRFRRSPLGRRRTDGGPERGALGTVSEFYNSLRFGRLLIVGDPGSGKTVLAGQLILDQLVLPVDAARQDERARPVPVYFSLASFDVPPGLSADEAADDLDRRLSLQLSKAHRLSRRVAEQLVRQGRILPVLDGLDEMDPEQGVPERALTLAQALNRHAAGGAMRPVVVTCRTERLRDLLAQPDSPRQPNSLRNVTVVELEPLDPEQITDYLLERFADPASPGEVQRRWRPVVDELRDRPAGALARALGSPLRLYLAVTGYRQPAADPGRLVGLPAEELERRLFARLVPALTEDHPRRGEERYATGDVTQWLGAFARHIHALKLPGGPNVGVPPLQLWRIAGDEPQGTVFAAIASLAVGLLFALFPFPGPGIPPGVAHASSSQFASTPAGSLTRSFIVASLSVLIGFVARGLAHTKPADPVAAQWYSRRRPARSAGSEGRAASTADDFRLLAVMLALFIVIMALTDTVSADAGDLFLKIAEACAITLVMGSSVYISLQRCLTARSPGRAIIRWRVFSFVAVASIPSGTLGVISTLANPDGAPTPWSFTITAGFVAIFFCPVTLFAVGFRWGAVRGVTPARPARFFDWAFRVGLLRMSGVRVQFRHLEVQRWFLEQSPGATPARPGSGGSRRRIVIGLTLLGMVGLPLVFGVTAAPVTTALGVPVVMAALVTARRPDRAARKPRIGRKLRTASTILAESVFYRAVLEHGGRSDLSSPASDERGRPPDLTQWRFPEADHPLPTAELARRIRDREEYRFAISGPRPSDLDSIADALIAAELGTGRRGAGAGRGGRPIPLRLEASDFDPGENWRRMEHSVVAERFDRWMAARIAEDHGLPPKLAAKLVKAALVWPIIDVSDRMTHEPTAPAVTKEAAILYVLNNTQPGARLRPAVLTIRTARLPGLGPEAATESGHELKDAGSAESISPSPTAIAAALERMLADAGPEGSTPARWLPLLEHLKTAPDGAPTRVLGDAQGLETLITAYGPVDTEPGELLDAPDETHLRERLYERFLSTVQARAAAGASDPATEHLPRRLTFLAEQLRAQHRNGGSERVLRLRHWWRAGDDRAVRIASAAVTGACAAIGSAALLSARFSRGIVPGMVYSAQHPDHLDPFFLGFILCWAGLWLPIAGNALMPHASPHGFFRSAPHRARRLRLLRPHFFAALRGTNFAFLNCMLACGVATGVGVATVVAVDPRAALIPTRTAQGAIPHPLVATSALAAIACGALCGLTVWLTLATAQGFGSYCAARRPSEYIQACWMYDTATAGAFGLITFAAAASATAADSDAHGPALLCRIAFLLFCVAVPLFLVVLALLGSTSLWVRHLVMALRFELRGELPRRPARLLDWACENTILRWDGSGVRFTDPELQEYLLRRGERALPAHTARTY